jgi:hypothetical protein
MPSLRRVFDASPHQWPEARTRKMIAWRVSAENRRDERQNMVSVSISRQRLPTIQRGTVRSGRITAHPETAQTNGSAVS